MSSLGGTDSDGVPYLDQMWLGKMDASEDERANLDSN